MKLRFWGVRGSYPVPGKETVKYGGNTSCTEIELDNGRRIVLDAGTGLIQLGKTLSQKKQSFNGTILLSHYHWDHIQGLPFLLQIFDPKSSIKIRGYHGEEASPKNAMLKQIRKIYCPFGYKDLLANFDYEPVTEGRTEVEGIQTDVIFMNHPGGSVSYKFHINGKKYIYVTDNDITFPEFEYKVEAFRTEDSTEREFISNGIQKVIDFVQDADILIHDSMYYRDEVSTRVGFGHSCFEDTVSLALEANVKKLILFHHDPDHNDEEVENILELSRAKIRNSGKQMECVAAQEGLEIEIT